MDAKNFGRFASGDAYDVIILLFLIKELAAGSGSSMYVTSPIYRTSSFEHQDP